MEALPDKRISMSPLERKPWYVGIVAFLATMANTFLMNSAGMQIGNYNLAQWLVYCLCLAAIWRGISFVGWLIVLMISPALAGSRTAPKTL
jgi:hypothetical protein